MHESHNALIPAGYDALWIAIALAALMLVVSAIASIARHFPKYGLLISVVWLIVVLALPIVGSIAWFVAGRGAWRPRGTGGRTKKRP
jgi:hypothetical protein